MQANQTDSKGFLFFCFVFFVVLFFFSFFIRVKRPTCSDGIPFFNAGADTGFHGGGGGGGGGAKVIPDSQIQLKCVTLEILKQ